MAKGNYTNRLALKMLAELEEQKAAKPEKKVVAQRVSTKKLPNILSERVKTEPRFATNIPLLDDCFTDWKSESSKGFIRSKKIIVTGEKGLGKTTFVQQMLDGLTGSGCMTFFATNEQSRNDIVTMGKRINLQHGINFVCDDLTTAADICAWVKENHEQYTDDNGKPYQIVLAIDSLGNLRDGDRNHSKYAFDTLRAFCDATGAILLLITHLTKTGDLSGSSSVEANCDTVIKVCLDGRRRGSDGISAARRVEIGKNRQGRGHVQIAGEMDAAHGIILIGDIGKEDAGVMLVTSDEIEEA